MVGSNGEEIALRSRRFIACHSKVSILNNAGVMWCAKESRMRVLMKVHINPKLVFH